MPRKRKGSENENANTKEVATKKKAVEKKKSAAVESPASQAPEKHLVVKIFVNAQTNEAFHAKYIKELKHQYEQIGHDEFLTMYTYCLKQLLAKDESAAAFANVGLKFMAKFATSFDSEDMHELSESVFNWVLKTVSLVPNIRSRMCRFVNLLLDSLGSNASLDDSLFDNILKYMFDRLKESYPMVRVQAIKALQRLQMPDDPDDQIVKIYTFHLASDPSGVVRQAVLSCLGRNIHTIPVILERLWDVDEKVRRHVYVHMANYPVKTYKVIHRLTFLEQGLNDRSDSVRKAVTSIMIPQWLESYNKNYLAFLSGLKLDSNDIEIDRFRATARSALAEIFKTQQPEDLINALSLDNDETSTYPKCIPFEKLTIESSLFWWSLIVYFQQDERRSDYVEMVIPELSLFCGYVQKYNDNIINVEKEQWEILNSQSILYNLIEILLTFDYGDEIGRQHLRSLAIHLLTTNPCNESIIKSLINICEKLIPNSDDRLQVYVDIIRSLVDQDLLEKTLNFDDPNVILSLERDPNLKVEVSSLKLKLFELEEEERKFAQIKDYASVSRISEQITLIQDQLVNLVRPLMTSSSDSLQQKRITKELQIKALKLAYHGVCSATVSKLNPPMCQLYTDFIRLKIESSDMDVRNWALKCGATFSLLYEQLAKDVFAALNKQFFDHHHTDVWTTSVGAMFQLIDRYGFSYFDEDNPNEENKQKEKSKKSRLLYNTTEYAEDPDEDNNMEKGNVTIKGLIYLFGHFMDTCDDIHLMSALIDGFGLLILHGVYVDEKLVSRLILLYFNPTTEAETNQILSIFFETLIHQKKQECLEAALIQTLTKIIEASNESALHEVKVDTVLKFIINSTLPVFCKSGVKIHDNIAKSLLKWMKDNTTNREVLKITAKEILTLDISDDNQLRQTLQDDVDELLELPLDSKTEKHLKLFKEQMQGNRPKDIQFSSVAPANRVEGELENDEPIPSEDESINRDDEERSHDGGTVEENSNEGVTNDNADESVNKENTNINGQANDTQDDGASESNESINTSENSLDTSTSKKQNKRKSLFTEEPNDKDASPAKMACYTSNEDTTDNETSTHQVVLQVDIHSQPVASTDSRSSSPEKRRGRVRKLLAEQQQQQESSPAIQSAPQDSGPRKGKKTVPPSTSNASSLSEPIKPGKRKIDSLKSSQSKGDFEEQAPKKRKSNLEVVSESGKNDTEKINNGRKSNRKPIEQAPVDRPTRRNKALDEKAATGKQTRVRNDKNNASKAIQKPLTSEAPTKSKKKVDGTEKSSQSKSVPDESTGNSKKNSDVSPSRTKKGDKTEKGGQKKSSPNTGNKSSKKKSDSRPPSRTSRRNRTLSQNSQNIDDSSIHISSRKTTPNSTPVSTPQSTTVTKNSLPTSLRQRQVASAPQTRKVKPKVTVKNTASPKKQKDKTSKTSSLSDLNNPSILDQPQHRTRRAIAKELIFNNVMTRNRASGDGVKLLEKIDKSSTSTRRKGSLNADVLTEKALSTSKSKKTVEAKSSTTIRPRRLKSLEKK